MSNFKVVAVQTHKVQSDSKSEKMYKVLKADTVYYLLGGYELKNGMLSQTDKPISIYGDKIEVSAVVGENGSGKSSLIELMIRAINNFACYLLGEFRVSNAAEHLHYIENINVTIHFITDDLPGKLLVDGRKVVLTYGGKDINVSELNPMKRIENSNILNKNKELINIANLEFIQEWKPEKINERNEILADLFYTIVNNYSIYAYNSRDFSGENTDDNKAQYIYYEAKKRLGFPADWHIGSDDYNWLKGVFYKNDGYTTPIVLTPFRKSGNIDINDENEFAQIRLLSMLLYQNDNSTDEKYPFRIINKTKKVERILIGQAKEDYRNFSMFRDNLSSLLGVKNYEANLLPQTILDAYYDIFGFGDAEKDAYQQAAENYLVYKMIRISMNYKQFEDFHIKLKGILNKKSDENTGEQIKKLAKKYIFRLIHNPSHITQKWRQALALLVFRFYKHQEYNLDDIAGFVELYKKKPILQYPNTGDDFQNIPKPPIWEEADLLPPSFLNPTVQIFDQTDNTLIPFNTLSSGERQMIYFVYGFVYHLINVNSAHEDGSERVKYRYVFSIFEEIELYFHPDMQRLLVKRLIDAIQSLNLRYIKGIHLLFVTHSPFILSDIPRQNCLFLNSNGKQEDSKEMDTFGSNIYDMLRTGFFFDERCTMGAWAQHYIEDLIGRINAIYFNQLYRKNDSLRKQFKCIDEQKMIKVTPEIVEQLEREIDIISEPIIKNKLKEMLGQIKTSMQLCGN